MGISAKHLTWDDWNMKIPFYFNVFCYCTKENSYIKMVLWGYRQRCISSRDLGLQEEILTVRKVCEIVQKKLE